MPLVFIKEIKKDTYIGMWKIQETEEELLGGLQLKQHELDVIDQLSAGKRLLHWLGTRMLLRTMMKTSDYIDCGIDEHGKPYLLNSDYHISFSHSYDYAAVMISREHKVGIDIELIKHRIKSIRHKFLSDLELSQPQIGDNTNGLYVCWCAKEAIYKWHGKKGLEFKKHMHIKQFKLKDEGSLRAIVEIDSGNKEIEVAYFKTKEGYMVGYIAD
ncbi:MAG: 4'-phosphopantetheinyl transferase superfamily protein [Sphingobacteriales bacterium]|nr:MAG: 4'-phosphopantetheinyl transferase superfamily protein [Sphingobacteriales bacterium]